jgi:hypothetical protein
MANRQLLNKGVNRFVQLADDSDKVPDLQNKSYTDFRLYRSDWEKLELMHEVLQVRSLTLTCDLCSQPMLSRNLPMRSRHSPV